MHENEIKAEIKQNKHLDSYTIGTGKDGQIKVYFTLNEINDNDLYILLRRAIGAWKYANTVKEM